MKFLLEGEEETGGEHIEAYVKTQPPQLQADAAVICDTEMFAPEMPTICVGLRGIVYGDLVVEGANHDLHSGVYGGAAPNPIMAIAEILCALKDRDGHILIPGFYDRVEPPSPKEREAWARLPFDEERVHREGDGRPRTGRRARHPAVRARLGAADSRSPRHSRRLHRRGREDRDPRPRHGQDQHPPGGRPASR